MLKQEGPIYPSSLLQWLTSFKSRVVIKARASKACDFNFIQTSMER